MPKTLRYNNTVPGNIYYNNTKAKKVFYNNTLVWSSSYEKISSSSTSLLLYKYSNNHKGGSSPAYAFFVRCDRENPGTAGNVTVFNSSLTKLNPTVSYLGNPETCCENIGNYMLVNGGSVEDPNNTSYNWACEVYNLSSLTKTYAATSAYVGVGFSGNINNQIAVFCGTDDRNHFVYLNTSLTGYYTNTIYGLYDASSVSIPNYILIGLIATSSYMSPSSSFYYINQSLTFSSSEQRFPIARCRGAAESINNYAIFAGGENGNSTYYNNVDIFNTALTRSNGAALSTNKQGMASAHTSNYAMFGGGYPRTNLAIDIYDTSLTHTSTIDTSVQEQSMIGASVGDYILFAGGLKTAVQIYSA